MSRRIDIELTSARPDGTWTWRAAGAREPKGVLEGSLLPEGAKAGDVLRAEADFAIDGIDILTVLPPKEKKRSEPERLEILGSGRGEGPGVTTQLAGRRGRGGDDRPRRDRPRRDTPRPEGERRGGPRRSRREDAPAEAGAGTEEKRRDQDRRREGGARRPAEAGQRRGSDRADRGDRADRAQAGRPATPGRTRAKRLTVGNVHRAAFLDSLAPEERAVAEQVLRGGVPAVRTALHLERERAVAEGRSGPDTDALLTLAERLLPRLRSAEWRDRAEAASKSLEDISLRDLRAVVTGADLARDDESRALAATLREALDAKLTAMREGWYEEIRGHLAAGRTIRAVRLSGRPPEPSSRLPADLLEELTIHAGRTLGPSTSNDAWVAMLEAVASSPVRRNVKPEGLPSQATPEVHRAAQQHAGRIPAVAALLGMSIPPPPGPRRRLDAAGAGGPRPTSGPPQPPAPTPEAQPHAADTQPHATDAQPPAPAPQAQPHAADTQPPAPAPQAQPHAADAQPPAPTPDAQPHADAAPPPPPEEGQPTET